MYKKRYLENIVLHVHKTFKVLYLSGPRQVGKTTLLLNLAKKLKMNYVSLDDLNLRILAKTDPELFLETFKTPLFIDEAQYAPELFSSIKLKVDKSTKKGQFWLTGSPQFSVMKNINESLAGRVGILNLLGFSFAEIYNKTKNKQPFLPTRKSKRLNVNSQDVFENILRGSLPALLDKNPPNKEIFYNSYVKTYLERDLKEIFNISDLLRFHRFLELCAARTGQILNYSDLARDSDISLHTAKQWISVLENTLQIYLLRPYFNNFSKRIIKAPKLYFLDTGLAAYLSKWKDAQTLQSGSMAGAFFETFVICEIIKSYMFRGIIPNLYYFRDKEGHEVDLIIEEGSNIYIIEIKMASSINIKHASGIKYLAKKMDRIQKSAIISLSKEAFPLDRNINIIPIQEID